MAEKVRPRQDFDRDLGLGSRVADQRGQRFLNSDGSFNVRRKGQSLLESLNVFHWLLNISAPRFALLVTAVYLMVNLTFALGYFLCGPQAFNGIFAASTGGRLRECFFFSVQTLATIGYGRISPVSISANVLVTVESLVGLTGIALVTGIVFSRFSRPTAAIIFSRRAVIAPYHGISGFMFRIVNARTNQLIQVQATVNLARLDDDDGKAAAPGVAPTRSFYTLDLERRSVTFFPLHWVVVHPIDENSPLHGWTAEQLAASDAEFTVLLTATDETFSQTVHARSSYKFSEVVWGAKFVDIFVKSADRVPTIDLRKLHDIEKAPLPVIGGMPPATTTTTAPPATTTTTVPPATTTGTSTSVAK
jgi:inward rectifier potassium channel